MTQRYKYVYLLTALLFFAWTGHTQVFPVSASLQAIPPHSASLADLVAPASNNLSVTLNLNDAEEISYQVRLRVTIEGNGITLTTKNNINFTPIELVFGSPLILQGIDLQEYFDPAAFNFSGYSITDYLTQGGLPDGFYTICVEAFDYVRSGEGAASPKACAMINATLLDAPVILTPVGAQTPVNPQYLAVQWQNLHDVPIPVEHEVEIYTWPYASLLSPNQVVQFDLPFFSTTLMSTTSYILTGADPPLVQGERYLIQVRATDLSGSYIFKNQGVSELQVFTYGSQCPAPIDLVADDVTEESITVTWNSPNTNFNSYIVRYREKLEGANWYEDEVVLIDHTIEDLADNTTYEVQVQTLCGGTLPGLLTPILEITTDSTIFDPNNFDCGDATTFPVPTNVTPISANQLSPGDYITIAGFDVKIMTIGAGSAANSFKGSCHIDVGWLGQKFYAKFKNLYINTDKEVYDGNIICKSKGLNSLPGFISPDSIKRLRAAESLTDFCGNLKTGIRKDKPKYTPDIYATTNTGAYSFFVPTSGVHIDTSAFYDPYNPYNPRRPYDPSNFDDPNNPYTASNPNVADNLWNPYNPYNPYNPKDYDDPANPYTPANPYDPTRLHLKNGTATSGSIGTGDEVGAKVLPFGLTSMGGSGKNYMIALDKMKFTTKGAILDAYISLDIPKKGGKKEYASFKLKGAQFHPGGLVGESKLILDNDVSFPVGDKAEITFNKGKFTYVSWDCDGFKGVSVKGNVKFCRDVMLPINWRTKQIDDSTYVTGYFYAAMPEWGEFVADLSMAPFEVPDLEDWVFVVENAVFDFSESITPASVTFPKNYTHPDVNSNSTAAVTGSGNPAWTGFYLKSLRVRLPKKFKKKKSLQDPTPEETFNPSLFEEPDENDTEWANLIIQNTHNPNQLEIGAENILVDATGLTAYVYGANVLKLEEGKVGTWAFAIDSVGIGIQSNQFHTAYLKGKVDIPALKHKMGYVGLVQPAGKYLFQLSIQDTMNIKALQASLDIYPNSSFTIAYNNAKERFEAGCKLNGYATFNASMKKDTTAGGSSGGTAATEKDKLKIPNIRFQNFEILSTLPYLKIGTWALSSENSGEEPSGAGFPITINDFGIFQNMRKDKVAILIDATVNFTPSEDMGIAANGQLGIVFDIETDTVEEKQNWVFEKVKVGKLGIDASGPGFKFEGSIIFYDSKPVYGSGFRGSIQAEFVPKISVAVVAQFGKVDGYRYAFADALVAFDPGIALGQSGLALYGFGGGFSYKMKRTGFNSVSLPPPVTPPATPPPTSTTTPPPTEMIIPSWLFDDPPPRPSTPPPPLPGGTTPPAGGTTPNQIPISERIGFSLSGTQYVPDPDIGVGIKAMIALGAVKREVFHGTLTFEVIFNATGGLHQVGFDGDFQFLTIPAAPGQPKANPAIRAKVSMLYDFPDTAFHANMDMYVNAVEGTIKGAYSYDLAGSAIFHADPDGWYLNIGTPTKPVKLSLDVTAIAGLAKDQNATGEGMSGSGTTTSTTTTSSDTTARGTPLLTIGEIGIMLSSYLCAGTTIPSFPQLPSQVQTVLGNGYNITSRSDPAFSNGGGILFGAQFAAQIPESRFLIFFADFYAGLGFDVGLINYGPEAMCAGVPGSAPIGFEGWYASGQMYAYILGEIGIFVKVFGVEAQIPIIDIGLAAVLQAQFPEPWWLKGTVGGNYIVLNGLVSGSCKFEFEVGEKCEIVSSLQPPSPTADFISGVWPAEDATDVDVFTTPQATFSLPIDKAFYFDNGSGTKAWYKAELLELSLSQATPSGDITPVTEIVWNSKNDVAALDPRDILSPFADFEFKIKVVFKTRASTSDPWTNLYDENGDLMMEQKTVSFTSGEAPTRIDQHNVAYSHPIFNQLYFLQDESNTGYIKLKDGMPYLFKTEPTFYLDAAEWNQKVSFRQNGTEIGQSTVGYNANEMTVTFAIPPGLANNTITNVQLVNVPTATTAAVDANVDSVLNAYVMGGVSDSTAIVNIRGQEVQEARSDLKTESFFDLFCRTSNYNTWQQKVNGLDLSNQYREPFWIYPPPSSVTIPIIGATVEGVEKFDKAEFNGIHNGTNWLSPMITIESNLTVTGSNWFADIQDTMYNYVPNTQFPLNRRVPTVLGAPPAKAINVSINGGNAQELTSNDVASNSVNIIDYATRIRYKVGIESKLDFNELYYDIANQYPNGTSIADIPLEYQALLNWNVPKLLEGGYEVKLMYTLPGKTEPSSTVTTTFQYTE